MKITGDTSQALESATTDNLIIDPDSGHFSDRERVFDNYLICEFVVVPHDFEIESLLTLREQAGIFPFQHINLEHLRIISASVKYSPVYNMLNNSEKIDYRTCLYFLHILHEAGLILETVDSPVRRLFGSYERMIDSFTPRNVNQEERTIYVDSGTKVNNLNFSIINMFNLLTEEMISKSVKKVNEFLEYQEQIRKGKKGKKID